MKTLFRLCVDIAPAILVLLLFVEDIAGSRIDLTSAEEAYDELDGTLMEATTRIVPPWTPRKARRPRRGGQQRDRRRLQSPKKTQSQKQSKGSKMGSKTGGPKSSKGMCSLQLEFDCEQGDEDDFDGTDCNAMSVNLNTEIEFDTIFTNPDLNNALTILSFMRSTSVNGGSSTTQDLLGSLSTTTVDPNNSLQFDDTGTANPAGTIEIVTTATAEDDLGRRCGARVTYTFVVS